MLASCEFEVLPPRIPSDPQSWQSQGRVGREAGKEYSCTSCPKKKAAPVARGKHTKMCQKLSHKIGKLRGENLRTIIWNKWQNHFGLLNRIL